MKTYKFWNPDLVARHTYPSVYPLGIDPHTCTAAELERVEDKLGDMSTQIELLDDQQAAAVAELILNEWNGEPRYEATR
jgi:hypothetical protein